jgi:hypothetical protein
MSEVRVKASVERSIPWDGCSYALNSSQPVCRLTAGSVTDPNQFGWPPALMAHISAHWDSAWRNGTERERRTVCARPGGERHLLGLGHQGWIRRRPQPLPELAVSPVASGSRPSPVGAESPLGPPPEPTVPGDGPPSVAPSGSRLHRAGLAAGPTPYPVAPACGCRQALALPPASSSRSARRRMSARL